MEQFWLEKLGIPAIVGAAGATELLRTGESLLLNGETGEIYRFQGKTGNRAELSHSQLPSRVKSAGGREMGKTFFNYPIATQLMVNLSAPSSIANAAALPVDGVGLVRSELMLQDWGVSESIAEWPGGGKKLQLLDKLTELITQLAAAFTPRPLFYRSTDWHFSQFPPLSNPIQRNRGTYNYLLDSTLFDLELEAIARALDSGYSNINLILPFVRSVEEFSFCRRRLETRGIIDKNSFQLWIMAEVPSILFLLPQYVEAGVQGISIGTNDLTQLLLGVDREEAMVSTELNARHPAMLEAMEQLIRQAKKAGIPTSICGQAPVQYPEIIDQLVQWGITSISVEPEAVERTYQAIARAEQRLLLEAARLLRGNNQSKK